MSTVSAHEAWLLEARSLTRRFGGLLAVDGVDLSVGRGSVHGLIGPNGAGKTTLLNLVAGVYGVRSRGVGRRSTRLEVRSDTVPTKSSAGWSASSGTGFTSPV